MSKSFPRLLCLVVALVLALSVVAFAEEKTQLTFMCYDESNDNPVTNKIKELVEEFNATNPYNVVIVPEYIASEQTKTKLPTLMAANAAPDIFHCWAAGFLQPYVEAGKVYCLEEAFAADPEWKATYKDGVFDSLTYDGKIYAVPSEIQPWGMYYNTTIYERCGVELPTTWEELVEGLEIIKEKEPDLIPFAYGNKEAYPIASLCEGLSNRIGGQEKFDLAAVGELPWTEDCFVEAATLIKGLIDEGFIDPSVNGYPMAEGFAQFKSGKAAVLSFLNNSADIFSADAVITKDEVEFRNIPMVEGGAGDPNWWLGQVGTNYAISESCPNKEAAVAFVKLLTGPKCQVAVLSSDIVPVLRSDVVNTDGATPYFQRLMKELDNMTGMFVFYDVVLGSVLGNEYNSTIQSVVGGTDPYEAMETYNQFFQENMDF